MRFGEFKPRRAGLSRNAHVEPLLSSFKQPEKMGRRSISIKEPDDPAAPPMSDSSSDDDDATSRRGDMKRATFGTKPSADEPIPTFGIRRSARKAPKTVQSSKRPLGEDDNLLNSEDDLSEPVPLAKKARVAVRRDNGLGAHFNAKAVQRKAVGATRSYGTQKSGYGKSARTASTALSVEDDNSLLEASVSQFKPPSVSNDLSSSPEKATTKLILPDQDDLCRSPSTQTKFKAPPKALGDEGVSLPAKPFKRYLDPSSPESSPVKGQDNKSGTIAGQDERMKFARLARKQKKKQGDEEKAQKQRDLEMTRKSPKVVFKMPPMLNSQDDLAYNVEIDVSDPSGKDQSVAVNLSIDDDEPVCPVCREPVEQGLLDQFSKKLSTVKQQIRFCSHHKKTTARDTWTEKGYPNIDWSSLDDRIAKHHDFLQGIVDGGASHFGTLYVETIKAATKTSKNTKCAKGDESGKPRTLASMADALIPGYYGGRGSRAMTDHLVNRFGKQLPKVALRDRLVAAKGHMSFVQHVLVPELAVRLIMDDMDVTAGNARKIMKESQMIGEMLNEEEDDVIVNDYDDEEMNPSEAESMSPLSSLGDSEDLEHDDL